MSDKVKDRIRHIKPITLLKVQKYLQDVRKAINNGDPFSLDKLARARNISGSSGTALIRLGYLNYTDLKGIFTFNDTFDTSEVVARRIVEEVRRTASGNQSVSHDQESGDPLVKQLDQAFKTNAIKGVLQKALNQAMPKPDLALFNDVHDDQESLVRIASAIASGVYSDLGFFIDQDHQGMVANRIDGINTAITFAAKDLLSKLKS